MSRILTRKLAMQDAKQRGCRVITGNRRKILLDLDTPEDVEFYEAMLSQVAEHLGIVESERWESSNGGTHVVLKVEYELSTRTRLLIQACLGSDRLKEFLSLVRLWKGDEDPIMLFRPPAKKRQVRGSPLLDDDVPF